MITSSTGDQFLISMYNLILRLSLEAAIATTKNVVVRHKKNNTTLNSAC